MREVPLRLRDRVPYPEAVSWAASLAEGSEPDNMDLVMGCEASAADPAFVSEALGRELETEDCVVDEVEGTVVAVEPCVRESGGPGAEGVALPDWSLDAEGLALDDLGAMVATSSAQTRRKGNKV